MWHFDLVYLIPHNDYNLNGLGWAYLADNNTGLYTGIGPKKEKCMFQAIRPHSCKTGPHSTSPVLFIFGGLMLKLLFFSGVVLVYKMKYYESLPQTSVA